MAARASDDLVAAAGRCREYQKSPYMESPTDVPTVTKVGRYTSDLLSHPRAKRAFSAKRQLGAKRVSPAPARTTACLAGRCRSKKKTRA